MTGSCPSENALVAHCAGRSPAQVGLLDHLDDCHNCQAVVAAMMQSVPAATDGPRPIRPQTLEISSTIANRYEVRELLGWGGMGEVYSAWDRHLNESVALKTLSILKVDAPELAARLRGEAQLARKVTHPNVVRIFDFGTHRVTTDDSDALLPFLTMELLSGQTLGGRLRSQGPYRAAEGIPIAIDMLRGLGAVHAVGIVHRDLKPDNVFLTNSDGPDPTRTVLTDFGLARALGSDLFRHSQSGTIVGTFAYLSPEQLEGKVATKASDIYAFGIVLFEMLTGQLPGSNPGTHQDPKEPTSTQPGLVDLPTSVRRIVSKCLNREPDRRYALTETIIEDLTKALDELPAETGWTRSRLRRAFSLRLALIVAALATGGASLTAWQAGTRTDKPPTVLPALSRAGSVHRGIAFASTAQIAPTKVDAPLPSLVPQAVVEPTSNRIAPRMQKRQLRKKGPPPVAATQSSPPTPEPIRIEQPQVAPVVSPSHHRSSRHPDDVIDPFAAPKR